MARARAGAGRGDRDRRRRRAAAGRAPRPPALRTAERRRGRRISSGSATMPLVQLASVMDHTPGPAAVPDGRGYYRSLLPAALPAQRRRDGGFIAERQAEQAQLRGRAIARRSWRAGTSAGIAFASHDDATGEQVAESLRDGVDIAEFPTTLVAAEASHEAGLAVLMGAPNVVRGGSHSGNISATDLARRGLPRRAVLGLRAVRAAPRGVRACRRWSRTRAARQRSRMVSPQPGQGGASRRPRRDRSGQARRPGAGAACMATCRWSGRVAAGAAGQLMGPGAGRRPVRRRQGHADRRGEGGAGSDDPRFVFPRRLVTRRGGGGARGPRYRDAGRNLPCSEANGAFALSWEAHGLALRPAGQRSMTKSRPAAWW